MFLFKPLLPIVYQSFDRQDCLLVLKLSLGDISLVILLSTVLRRKESMSYCFVHIGGEGMGQVVVGGAEERVVRHIESWLAPFGCLYCVVPVFLVTLL